MHGCITVVAPSNAQLGSIRVNPCSLYLSSVKEDKDRRSLGPDQWRKFVIRAQPGPRPLLAPKYLQNSP
jgi:hypothetical protein